MEWVKTNWRVILLGIIASLLVITVFSVVGQLGKQAKLATIPDDAIIIYTTSGRRPIYWIPKESLTCPSCKKKEKK
jgi:hypothetical protein